jgi:hypothetical protein
MSRKEPMIMRMLCGLLVLVFSTAGCKDQEAQRKIDELQAQLNALQKRQQEEAAKPAQKPRAPAQPEGVVVSDAEIDALVHELEPTSFVGNWNLTYTANHSTCQNAQVGDVRTATLQVSFANDELRATESTPGNKQAEYVGEVTGKLVRFNANVEGSKLTLELRPSGKGRRVVVNEGCSIIYDVKGKKAR